jgi:hypothetical protein
VDPLRQGASDGISLDPLELVFAPALGRSRDQDTELKRKAVAYSEWREADKANITWLVSKGAADC